MNPFLRIPPFPRHRAGPLVVSGRAGDEDPVELARVLVEEQVGGAFWAPGSDPWSGRGDPREQAIVAQLRAGAGAEAIMAQGRPRDPFTGVPMTCVAAARMLGAWRRMIEENRRFAAIFGIAGWKRATLDALLWDGVGVPYRRSAAGLGAGDRALAWVARSPAGLAGDLAARGVLLGEIEDGFIRSSGLGAHCVAPLSVIVDPVGTHIDPARPSGLEMMLARGNFSPDVLARAAALRSALIAGGIGKYGAGGDAALPPRGRRRVLVIGQVEDDRAVLIGGAGCDNRALLARARAMEPGAEILYKPHPDVEAGLRKGAIPDAGALRHADRIERAAPIAALLAQVDVLHVISSLAGFEALLRGVEVITHGQPFYAGWGLTRDLAPQIARRGRVCTVDEMVAAALILYPRCLDPVTRLPCPVEVLVRRIADGQGRIGGPLVWARMAQGRLRAMIRGRGGANQAQKTTKAQKPPDLSPESQQ